MPAGASEHLFVTGLVDWLESDSSKATTKVAWGTQGGFMFDVAGANLTAAVGYYDIPVKGNEAYYKEDFYGNSFVVENGTEVYQYDYQLLEVGAQLVMNVLDLPLSFMGTMCRTRIPMITTPAGWQV